MYSIQLNGKQCFCCGICLDVCARGAIAMRTKVTGRIEGNRLSYLRLRSPRNREVATAEMGTFPYLRFPELCDGCALCATQCPVTALELRL
jgi:ferredoxin